MSQNDDGLDIPDFLKRAPMTKEDWERINRMTARARNPKIKNPPRRTKKASRLLGAPIKGIKSW